jgi:hypothetical protein
MIEIDVIHKLINIFKDSNIEDMELSKLSLKAIYNMVNEKNFWKRESIKLLDDLLTNMGDEIDSMFVRII